MAAQEKSELKPCPFCGCSEPRHNRDHLASCYLRMLLESVNSDWEKHSKEDLMKAWDIRAGDQDEQTI